MRKIVTMVALALAMALCAGGALADGMGVQIIGGDVTVAQTVTLDDLPLGEAVEVDYWGTITATACKYVDGLHQYAQGRNDVGVSRFAFESGIEAEYLLLQCDIVNTTAQTQDYLAQCEVKAVINDDAEFAGWCWQYNWSNGTEDYGWGELNGIQNKEVVIDKADQFAIDPWYTGHYVFGCTLPNAAVESELPLRLEINIGGNEITYHIRK